MIRIATVYLAILLSYWLTGVARGATSPAGAAVDAVGGSAASDAQATGSDRTTMGLPVVPTETLVTRWSQLPATTRSVEVDIPKQQLYLNDGKQHQVTFAVSTGINISTPRGTFRVIEKVASPSYSLRGDYAAPDSPKNPLGAAWIGLNAQHWRTGAPIGIHGTNEPDRIGSPVSHGCVRLKNEDVRLLLKHMPIDARVVIHD